MMSFSINIWVFKISCFFSGIKKSKYLVTQLKNLFDETNSLTMATAQAMDAPVTTAAAEPTPTAAEETPSSPSRGTKRSRGRGASGRSSKRNKKMSATKEEPKEETKETTKEETAPSPAPTEAPAKESTATAPAPMEEEKQAIAAAAAPKSGPALYRIRTLVPSTDMAIGTTKPFTIGEDNGMGMINLVNKRNAGKPMVIQMDEGGSIPGYGVSFSTHNKKMARFPATIAEEEKEAVYTMERAVADYMVAKWSTLIAAGWPLPPGLDDSAIRGLCKSIVSVGTERAKGGGKWPDSITIKVRPGDLVGKGTKKPTLYVVDKDNKPLDLLKLAHMRWSTLLVKVTGVYVVLSSDGKAKLGQYGLSTRLMYARLDDKAGLTCVPRHVSETILDTSYVMGESLIMPKGSPHKIIDMSDVQSGGKVGVIFNKGGWIPREFGVESSEQFGGVALKISVHDLGEDQAMRRIDQEIRDKVVERRAAYLPGNRKSDDSVKDMLHDLISQRKPKLDKATKEPTGEEWPAMFKCRIRQGDMEALEAGRPGPSGVSIVDTAGKPVPLSMVPGMRWVELSAMLRCVYVQGKALGVSRQLIKLVVQHKEEDDFEVPTPLPM